MQQEASTDLHLDNEEEMKEHPEDWCYECWEYLRTSIEMRRGLCDSCYFKD